MLKISTITLAATLLLFFSCEAPAPDVEVSDAVMRTAKTFNFDYLETLKKAKDGDMKSIAEFVRFHKYTDEIEGINHGVACLELILFATDATFATACNGLSVGVKKVLWERLQIAQARTKKEELRKPLKDWAPQTWRMLNTEEVQAAKVDSRIIVGKDSTVQHPEGYKPREITPPAGKEILPPK